MVYAHGKLKIPVPRDEPGSGNWHYCGFFVNQYYLRGNFNYYIVHICKHRKFYMYKSGNKYSFPLIKY